MDRSRTYKDWKISFSGHQDPGGRWCDEARLQIVFPGGVYERRLGGEVFFEVREEAVASARDLAMEWIDNDGRIPLSRVIGGGLPFRFSIGDPVRSRVLGNARGRVCEGFFSGDPHGEYRITYQIRREDGVLCLAREGDLDAFEE